MTNRIYTGGRLFVLAVVITAPFATGQGHDQLSNRINPENEARENEFPFTVLLRMTNFTDDIPWQCSGSLVRRRWVLTSADCLLYFRPGSEITAYAGNLMTGVDNVTSSFSQSRIVVETVLHPAFILYGHDIALLRLNKPFDTTGEKVSTASLLTSRSFERKMLANTKKCFVVGSGLIKTGDAWSYPTMVSKLAVRFVNETEVLMRGYTNTTGDYKVEAIYDDACQFGSPCFGDEGGPLVCKKGGKWIQAGLYSWGFFYDGCITGVKYATNVLYNTDWIDSVIS